jgi:general secretion pathway protein I
MKQAIKNGFTLIEVLIALAIIAIALTALLKASSEDVSHSTKIKERTISHWVAMQGINAIQLNLLPIHLNQEISEVTTMLGERWYWRARVSQTEIPAMQLITLTVSNTPNGPFTTPLYGFRRVS